MTNRLWLVGVCGLTFGCVKELSSDERLDRETAAIDIKKAMADANISKLNCDDAANELVKARAENRSEQERLQAYADLYRSLKERTEKFDAALSSNPDLAYRDGTQDLLIAKDVCNQQAADARLEFDRYLRELVDVPTLQEVKGGGHVTIARVDFEALRQAVETLGAEDKEFMLTRIAIAEKKLATTPAAKGAAGKKK